MEKIIIHEVGLRDGLQMEQTVVPVEKRIEWIENLITTGIDIIQLGSFVNPEKMPQMAATDELFRYFQNKPNPQNVIFSALVLNEKGMQRGMECGVEIFCMGVSASETHSKKNTGMTVAEATERIINMAKFGLSDKKIVQVSVQSAFGCGFEGRMDKNKVLDIVKKYFEAGLTKISLADTAGHGNPAQVEDMFGEIIEINPDAELACHFHNTYGMGLANCYAALKVGIKSFESAFGGLGGCPFTKLAAGNVCTEDLVHFFQNMNMRQDINLDKLIEIAKDVSIYFNRDLPGMVYKSGPIRH